MRKNRPDVQLIILIALLGVAFLGCGAYLLYNYVYLPARVEKQSAWYEQLYRGRATVAPASAAPSAAAAPTAAPTELPDVQDIPLGTPDPDTLIYEFPIAPPVQDSFAALIQLNPETVGFLTIGDMVSLPVAQRENDNAFYLTHDFEGNKSQEGCLFLDGVNRLALDDELLIVYGHNMKNGTMFGNLSNFSSLSVLEKNAIVSFDTIYENRSYVPFACFALTADQSASSYLELRKFQFTQSQFDDYVAQLKARSLFEIPVDVQYGDDILLLVTCNYSVEDGRFCVALRALRDGEAEADARALVGQTIKK